MKIFTKQIKTCDDCPNLSDGAMSNCTYDKKNPKMICSFLDKIQWLKDKILNIHYLYLIGVH